MAVAVSVHTNHAEAIGWVADAKWLALDIETSGLDPWSDRIAVITLKDKAGHVAVVRCHDGVVPGWLRDKLNEPGLHVTGHNLVGFDALCLHQAGVDLTASAEVYDTMVGELVTLTSGRRDVRVNLGATVKRRTGKELNKEVTHGGWENEELTDEQLSYVHGDVDQLEALEDEQWAKVRGTPREMAMEFEQALVPITVGMTVRGMPFDEEAHGFLIGEARARIANATPVIEAKLGEVNMRSHVQVKRALHSIGLEVPNTRKETMTQLAEELEDMGEGEVSSFAKTFVKLRQDLHRSNVWDEAWVDEWLKADGCIHGKYWQMGTDTIRYSATEPNPQQTPREWRGMYGGKKGWKVVAVDYSQLEVRVAACIFNDRSLADSVMSEDVHKAVYAKAMNLDPASLTKEQRRLGKAMNFLLIFGGGPTGFYEYARMYGSSITLDDSKRIVYGYWDSNPGIFRARKQAIAMCDSGRPVTLTLPMGHQRVLFGDKLGPTVILNTSVQGTAATGIKCAMLEMRRRGMDRYLRAQIHDELFSFVPEDEAEEFGRRKAEIMRREMEKILPPLCPIECEVKIGDFWS